MHGFGRWLVLGAMAAQAFGGAAGCSSTTIALKEKFGIAKRDQLVARVKDARDEQQEAKQQFASALEEFLAVTGAAADAGVADLERRYNELKRAYDRSE